MVKLSKDDKHLMKKVKKRKTIKYFLTLYNKLCRTCQRMLFQQFSKHTSTGNYGEFLLENSCEKCKSELEQAGELLQ